MNAFMSSKEQVWTQSYTGSRRLSHMSLGIHVWHPAVRVCTAGADGRARWGSGRCVCHDQSSHRAFSRASGREARGGERL